ncbi:MAG: adenylate/guanylate cyclase domain-containing protein [Thermoplasmata archaeon]
MAASQRRLAAIMFTDMVGYSALAQADEATALGVLERHNRLLRPIFPKFRGREVKTVGDAFLVEFESVLEAVRCALEIQRVLREYNEGPAEEWRIRIRVGIHVGDVVETGGDVLGDAVNIASRIEPLADPGGICLSQQAYDQVQNKISASFAKLPAVSLKNIHVPMGVYKVLPSADRPTALPRTPVGRHLAVLPLANISPDPNDGYFADGLTEEIISVLSEVRGLSVIARTSVAPYKTAPKSVAEVGAELGVDTVLEGSVRKAGNRIRITLQLIDVASQRHIWASSYNREIDDVFAVQTDIAERTAEALRLEVAKSEDPCPVRGQPTNDFEAYDYFLRGLVAASGPRGSGIDEAVHCFEQATQRDPAFAEAFAAWAELYVVVAGDFLPMKDVMPRARVLAARALELDPESSAAYAALANIAFQFDHDWRLAEEEFRRSIALNPSNVSAHRFLGLMLLALQRYDEARDVIRATIRLDPGGDHQSTLGLVDLWAGDYDAVIERQEKAARQESATLPAHTYLGMVYLTAGRLADATREANTPTAGASDEARFDHALLNALVGQPDSAREVLAEVERGEEKSYTSATHRAMLHAALGERARALDLLEKDARGGDEVLWLWYRGVWFDSIRDDPRFTALLRYYGLPAAKNRPPPNSNP